MPTVQQKITRHTKKQGRMAHSKEKSKSAETVSEKEWQISWNTVLKMLKELKKHVKKSRTQRMSKMDVLMKRENLKRYSRAEKYNKCNEKVH